jgi:hypothetical protein
LDEFGSVGLDQFDLVRLSEVTGLIRSGRVIYCRVISGFGSYQVGWGRLSGHFEFLSLSSHVRSVIGSYSVESFLVSGYIRLGQVGYRVIYYWFILGFESYQIGSGRLSGHLVSDHFGFRVEN